MGRLFWIGAPVAILAIAIWWLFLDSAAPQHADDVFDVEAYRAMVEGDEGLPLDIRMEIVGTDAAPKFAAETGGGFGAFELAYAAFQIVLPEETIVIGGALDGLTAEEIKQSSDATFDEAAYARLLQATSNADQVLITHEHLDHVMAITRHPDPASIAGQLRLTAPQIAALPQFAPPGEDLHPTLVNLAPFELDGPTKLAPGVVAAPAAGHSPGSIVFYAKTEDAREYFFIGDIVWAMSNIDTLKTRPRVLQYLFFEPDEDRPEVLRQVRALHDLKANEPDLVLLPEHDRLYLDGLVKDGAVTLGFE